jgi:transcriptional regulator with XRE-family HTH domain
MPGRLTDLVEIPDAFWARPDTVDALRCRDIGRLFRLLSQYVGASQTRLAIASDMTQPKVSGIMRGNARVETLEVFERIADGLNMPGQARLALGLAPKANQADAQPAAASRAERPGRDIPPGDARAALPASAVPEMFSASFEDREEEEDPVRRRTFVGLAGASLIGAILADTPSGATDDLESLASALATYWPPAERSANDQPPDMPVLADAVAQAKRDYQACRYSKVTKDLPALLARLRATCAVLDGEARLQAFTLSAEAHHVAASILLKTSDNGLGWLAADRSIQAARASEDPVTIGSSARIITHAMMSNGHLKAATSTASSLASNLNRDLPSHGPESLSVYGSLLLRGAIAAAQHGDRHTAYELLAEAEDSSARLGDDRNVRWTAFGPTNARLHRINIAVTLGDAGTALDVARTVDLDKVTVTERKAAFFVDTARAFLQCRKDDKALLSLRAADEIAHEEVAGRPAVHRLVRDLIGSAAPSTRRHAEDFASRIGVTR